MSEFGIFLFKLCDTKISMSFAYLLETDEQTERINMSLEDMLKIYVGEKQQSWYKWLYLI